VARDPLSCALSRLKTEHRECDVWEKRGSVAAHAIDANVHVEIDMERATRRKEEKRRGLLAIGGKKENAGKEKDT
jgi:hypothetical protein